MPLAGAAPGRRHGRRLLSPYLTFLLSAVVVVAAGIRLDLLDRSERRFWRVEPAPALVVGIYLGALLAVHRVTG